MRLLLLSFLIGGSLLILSSCNEEIDVGFDLIGDQPIDADFVDSFSLSSKTVYTDTIIRSEFDFRSHLLGRLDDPVFGVTAPTLFVTPGSVSTYPDLTGLSLDSVVMILNIDTINLYGNPTATHNISLHRLIDAPIIEDADELLTSFCYDYESTPIETITNSGVITDSVSYYNPRVDTFVTAPNQLRFQLDKSIWQRIGEDSLLFESTQAVVNEIKGYALVADPDKSNLFSVDMSSINTARIELYYLDSINRASVLPIGGQSSQSVSRSIKHSCLSHDYAGTAVGEALDNSDITDVNYLQGLQGVSIEVDLSDVRRFDKEEQLVNYAELTFYAQQDDDYPLIESLSAYYRNEDGGLSLIEDIVIGIRSINFDGVIQEEDADADGVQKYRLIITNHIINMLNDEITSSSIFIQPERDATSPNRTIFYGTDHPDYPATLKIFSTKP